LRPQYRLIGLLWLLLTLLFEFGFGRLVQHKAWAQLLRAYTFEGATSGPSCSRSPSFRPGSRRGCGA